MVQHLQQVSENIGVDNTLTAGRTFTERFLTAAKMSPGAAPEVRYVMTCEEMYSIISSCSTLVVLLNTLFKFRLRF